MIASYITPTPSKFGIGTPAVKDILAVLDITML